MEKYEKLNDETLKMVSGGRTRPSEEEQWQKCPICKKEFVEYYVNTYGKKVYVCQTCYVQWIPENQ